MVLPWWSRVPSKYRGPSRVGSGGIRTVTGRFGSGRFQTLAGRVGSAEKVFEIMRVGSAQVFSNPTGRVGSGRVTLTRCGNLIKKLVSKLRWRDLDSAGMIKYSAGMCQPNIPALFKAPALLGIGLLQGVTTGSYSRAKRFNRHYRGQCHY